MLLILLVALTLVFAVVLWGAGVFLQGWLYSDLANRLPARAAVGGLILAVFHTGWTAIYKADPGRFDTLVSFKTETLDGTYDEFQSVRSVNKKEQKPVRFVRRGSSNDFESAETGKPWNRSDADGMVVAILITEKGKEQPTRFDANLDQGSGNFRPPEDTKYEADGGKRYMDLTGLGKVYRKRTLAYMGNFFANLLHLAVWVAVLWPVMRFTLGHAIGIGLVLWAVAMLVVQPVLFGLVTK